MNITTLDQLNSLLTALRKAKIVAVDSETDGLHVYLGNRPISLSFFFPETGESYNLAWRHGQGTISVPADYQDTTNFHNWSWVGAGKKQVYKRFWLEAAKAAGVFGPEFFGNVSEKWLAMVRNVWNKRIAKIRVVYFNAPFDVHMMETIGFLQPAIMEDVRIAVGLVFEDWLHPSIKGNNTLKWQAAKWAIDGALDGETALAEAADCTTLKLAGFIAEHWDDDVNRSFHKLKRAATVEEIAKRVQIDPKSEMWCIPSHEVAPYAENDTRITWLLREKLVGMLVPYHQVQLYEDLCAVQAEFFIRVERNGLLLDQARTEELIEEMGPVVDEVNAWFNAQLETLPLSDEDLYALTDKTGSIGVSVNSPVKLKRALTLLTGEVWESTDKDSVEDYLDRHGETPAIAQLQRARHAQRAVKTYLKNWLNSVDENGFVHGSYNISGTVTGRPSSSSGTLGNMGNNQNIPTRGFNIKEAFVVPSGYGMFQIDYGQLELRLGAWIAGCETMIGLFESGADMHAYTRDQAGVFDILFPGKSIMEAAQIAWAAGHLKNEPVDEQTAAYEIAAYCRQVAKTLNFGLLYSGTWKMIDNLLGVGETVAKGLYTAWNDLYPEFAEANEHWKALALQRRDRPDGSKGGVMYVQQPISGRTRRYALYPVSEELYNSKKKEWFISRTRENAAKNAFNFVVQGLGAYIMEMSSLELCRRYPNDVFFPVASIHDSIVFYLRDDSYHLLPEMVKILCHWPIRPDLTADVEYSSTTWQALRGIKDLSAFVEEHRR